MMIGTKAHSSTQHPRHDDCITSAEVDQFKALWKNNFFDITEWSQLKLGTQKIDDDSSFALLDFLSAKHQQIDAYTVEHQTRVAKLCQALAIELGYDLAASRRLYYCGLMHDLGKALLPSDILHCRNPLTDPQLKLIRNHVQLSYELLKNCPCSFPIGEIVLQHHERINGSGYPNGLRAEQMYPEAQILIVADMMESMSLARSYRPALGTQHALAHIKKQAGLSLDTKVCQALTQLFEQHRFSFN